MQSLKERPFENEYYFKTSRSSGKGGQHVNKTESRVSLFFDLENSELLTVEEKKRMIPKLKNRLNERNVLQIDVEESRSQQRNKEIAIKRFLNIFVESQKPPKKRKVTKPNKAAIKRRLKAKKKNSEIKQNRRKDNIL